MRPALLPCPVRRTLVGVLAAALFVQLLVVGSGLACVDSAGIFMPHPEAVLGAAPAATHGPATPEMANHAAGGQEGAGGLPHEHGAPCGVPGSPGHCGASHGCGVQMIVAVALPTLDRPDDAAPPAAVVHAAFRDVAQPDEPPPRPLSASGAL